MGHIAEPAGGAVVVGCKVLPIFNENGIVDGAMKKIVHRIDGKKAVARVKELLKWAAQARPHSTTMGGRKWKKVLSFQARDGAATNKCGEQQQSDDMGSKLSFKWDVGSCSSASSVLYSPLSSVSAPAKTTTENTPSRNYVSRLSSMNQQSSSVLEPIAGLLYIPKNEEEDMEQQEEAACRMGQWITTDSDFVVLEL